MTVATSAGTLNYLLTFNVSITGCSEDTASDHRFSSLQLGQRPPPWSSTARAARRHRRPLEGPRRRSPTTSTPPSAPRWPGSWSWLSSLPGPACLSSCLIWPTTRPFQVSRGGCCCGSATGVYPLVTHLNTPE